MTEAGTISRMDQEAEIRWVASADQVAAEIETERIILNLSDGNYYRLAGVGSVIWRMLQNPVTTAEICAAVEAEFEAPPRDVVAAEVDQLLSDLETSGLAQRVG